MARIAATSAAYSDVENSETLASEVARLELRICYDWRKSMLIENKDHKCAQEKIAEQD